MSIFAISDLHLSYGQDKPMDIFGDNWIGHAKKISNHWKSIVKANDVVLLPGDFSWAMHLKDTIQDFKFLSDLPGKKILLKGNHDYWWTTLASMKNFLKENNFDNIDFLYNNSYLIENYIIAGTRGWSEIDCKNNYKMLNREIIRLELSIKNGIEKFGEDKQIIICMHYPPAKEFQKIIEKYNVKMVLYGHLHGANQKDALEEEINNINYKLVSCDFTNFELLKII